MSKKPGCNLCGASLVEEDYALICGDCARPREEWLKDQAEQLAIAHQMGYAEGEEMDVTHNVCCCISPEAIAAGKHEAYKQGFSDGGKTALDELMRRWNLEKLRREFERGEWPMKEKS